MEAESQKVGVVIPVFNTEAEILRECVQSVLEQSYTNLEILCIDDGSTDEECLEVLKKFARNDLRVTILHNPVNEGVSIARNLGIEWFSGDYQAELKAPKGRETLLQFNLDMNPCISLYKSKKFFTSKAKNFKASKIDYLLFLDSDDSWKPNLVESCLKYAKDSSVVLFDFLSVHDIQTNHIGSKVQQNEELLDKKRAMSSKEWVHYLRESENTSRALSFVWRIFIDFKYLKSIRLKFVPQVFMEDNLFSALLLYQAKTIYTLPEKLIYYRVSANSQTDFTKDIENVKFPKFLDKLCEKLSNNRPLMRLLYIAMSCYVLKLYMQDFVQENPKKYGIKILEEKLIAYFKEYYLKFLFTFNNGLSFDIDTYYTLLLNCLMHLNLHYKAAYPFAKINEALEVNDFMQFEKIRFFKEILFQKTFDIDNQENAIQALQQNIKDLEEENSALYLESLNPNSNLKIFR